MAEMGRAAIFKEIRKPFLLREFPVPEPEVGGLVVKIALTNVCGSDLHIWRGDLDVARMGLTYPIVLGHEMVGRVSRIGKGAEDDALGRPLKEGDRIVYTYFLPCGKCRACLRGAGHACMMSLASPIRSAEDPPHFVGGFATHYAVSPKQKVFKVPDGLSDIEVAGSNCALAQVIFGFEKAGIELGDTVVVQGAGGLGLYACAVAKELGASQVIAIDAVPARLELARQFGADLVLDVSKTEVRDRLNAVRGATAGWGADVVVEVAGFPEVVPEGLRMLGRCGRYLEIGNISSKRTYVADPSILVANNITVYGVSLYEPLALFRAVDFLERTRARYPFAKIFSHTFPLDKIDQAFAEADAFAKDPTSVTRAAVAPNGMG
jgi:D-arabinose 1-dehydrogenase-like Zn-dependent alcohol dehydrogenase